MIITKNYEGLDLSIELTAEELNNAYLERKKQLDCQEVYDFMYDWDLGEILKSCKFPYPGHAYILDERIEEAESMILEDKDLLSDIYDKYLDFHTTEKANYYKCMEWACEEILKEFGKKHPDFLEQFKDIDVIAYEKYKKAWVKERNYSPEFLAKLRTEYEEEAREFDSPSCFDEYIDKHGYDGDRYVCFEEFLEVEYQDETYMKNILTEKEFEEYCLTTTIENAKETALHDGYDQFIIKDGASDFSFARSADNKPVTPLFMDEKVIGKVTVLYENGCRVAKYKEISDEKVEFKIGDKVKVGYISDCNPHNNKEGTIIWMHDYNYYPNKDISVVKTKTQATVLFEDGKTEGIGDLYNSQYPTVELAESRM